VLKSLNLQRTLELVPAFKESMGASV
jgi:hypothetical protein